MIDLYLINKFLLNNLVNLEKLTINRKPRNRNSRKRTSYRQKSKSPTNLKRFLYKYIFYYILWICYCIWIMMVALQYYVDCNNSKISISVLIPLTFSSIYSLFHYISEDCIKN